MPYPCLKIFKTISFEFRPFHQGKIKTVSIDVVLDFNKFSDVIGFEIMNLKQVLSEESLKDFGSFKQSESYSIKYYPDVDILYIYPHIREFSLDQNVFEGKLFLDNEQKLLKIVVNIDNPLIG